MRPPPEDAGDRHRKADGSPVADPNGRSGVGLTFTADLKDAVAGRTVALVVGVLLLQMGFILSYVGAFHAPKPHGISLAVSAPASVAPTLIARINAVPSQPLRAVAVADETTARRDVSTGSRSAALLIDPARTTDRLLVASGGGSSVATAVETVVARLEAAQKRTVVVTDVVPLQAGDARGLTGFYLVIGWTVGGYLVAALLGVAAGARPATTRRAAFRLTATLPYAILSGLGGAIIAGPVLGAINGHLTGLWWLGVLTVMAAATVTMALQALFGTLGIGLTVLLFVVLGNPSAGGAYQPSLLPPFWRAISGALPNGAATDTVRRIVYFDGRGIAGHLAVLFAYAMGGIVVTLGASAWRHRGSRSPADVPVGAAPLVG